MRVIGPNEWSVLNVSSSSAVAPACPAEPVDGAQPAMLRKQANFKGLIKPTLRFSCDRLLRLQPTAVLLDP